MTAADITPGTYQGLLKKVYDNNFQDEILDNMEILDKIGFEEFNGDEYKTAVRVTSSQGVTYHGRGGVFTFEDPISGCVVQATANYTQLVVTDNISWDLFQSTKKAYAKGGEGAFRKAIDVIIKGIQQTARKRQVVNTFYGRSELGVVASVSSKTVTLTDQSFAPWIWAGSENTKLNIRTSTGEMRGIAYIASLDLNAKTITLDNVPTGLTAGDKLYYFGSYGVEGPGIKSILSTTTGTLFDVDVDKYSQWRGNTYNVNGVLSKAKLDEAVEIITRRGIIAKEYTLYINPLIWTDLEKELVTRDRNMDVGNSVRTEGANEIIIKSQMGVKIKIVPSGFVKVGDAFLLDFSAFKRLGTTDLALGSPIGGDIITKIPNTSAYTVTCYSAQSLFCRNPGSSCYLYGITKSS